ncbi:MAG: ABC transporter permease, partial [Lactovum sp.]
MDFIRRAWLFTKAKLSRTVLLIVAFTAILVFVLSGLIINSAANKSIENAKLAAGATVSLSVDMQTIIEKSQDSAENSTDEESTEPQRFEIDMPTISKEVAEEISELSNVKSYSLSYSASADASENIEKVSQTAESSSSEQGMQMPEGQGGPQGESQGDFSIQGTNDLLSNSSFTSSYEIIEGRAIESEDEGTNNVVIESTLASQNELELGSTFTLVDSNEKTYKMTVVGIFTTSETSTEQSIAYMNTLYTALSLANSMKATKDQISTANYSMTDPAKSETFVEKANKLIDDDSFKVSADTAAYENVSSSLTNVGSFAKNIVILVAVAGAIILALIVMLMVRERRFEIGVLMSLGESKLKIVGQFFVELFMVMLVSVAIATTFGGFVGNIIGQQLLNQETTVAQSNNMPEQGGQAPSENNNQAGSGGMGQGGGMMRGAGRAMGFGQTNAEAEALKELDIKTSFSEIILLLVIATLITLLAVGLASIGILRLNPKQVL